jgi:hypothetical protein
LTNLHHRLDAILLCLNTARSEGAVRCLRRKHDHRRTWLEEAGIPWEDRNYPDIGADIDLLLAAGVLKLEALSVRVPTTSATVALVIDC